MTDLRQLEKDIRDGLEVGSISYNGDSWYAASSDGGAGIGYEECERRLRAAADAVNALPYLRAVVEAGRRWRWPHLALDASPADPVLDLEAAVDALDAHLRGEQ